VGYLGNWLPVVWSGVALVALASPVLAKTPAEIAAVAKAVTVKIEHSNEIGTGVIVHKQGQVYSLVTNRHVVCGSGLCNQLPSGRQYRLSLPDGQQIQVSAKNIQLLGQGLDLAVIQFTSNQSYSIVRLEEPGKLRSQSKLRAQDAVFTAGFPGVSRQFEFGQGEAIAVVDRRIQGDRGGYSIVYNSPTLPGMSGGGVFNQYGELVAIHGQGDKYKSGTEVDDARVGEKIGLNRGIPIRWLVQGLGEKGIMVGERSSLSANVSPAQAPKVADEYFIAGFNKFVDPGTNITAGKKEAIAAFTKAIQLNSQYFYAYYVRAVAYYQIGEFQKALADCNKAISLQKSSGDALNPSLAGAYYNRGNLKEEQLNDPQGALADYNQAIALNPKYVDAYINRGNLKASKLNDLQGALNDYNQAVALNPKLIAPYYNRGVLRQVRLNDPQGALADYNQVIALNPNYANAYISRGALKADSLNNPHGALLDYNKAIALDPNSAKAYYNRGNLKVEKLNDPQGALVDFNRAIALNPNDAAVYINRGVLKSNKLNDHQGALADLNRAVAINPNLVNAYAARGVLKATTLKDRPGAIADLRQAARLARAQGQTQLLQNIVGVLNQLGATE
jgi:tetratricopeptide (TPR) repeat protein